MNWRELIAISAGKSILGLTRTLKTGGGSAAPGLYALKIYPQLISKLSQRIPQTVVITGTNGKTTTARMLAHFASGQGLKVLRNNTGSNLERGVASALINTYQVKELFREGKTGPAKYDLAIWELDEAAFNLVLPQIKPDIVIFLNVFRDQLDRYGEVDTVIRKWCEVLKKLNPKTTVLINNDDQNLHQLRNFFKGTVKTFGVENNKIEGEKVSRRSDKTKADFEATGLRSHGLDKTTFTIALENFRLPIRLPLPGIYNVYNFLASFAAVFEMKLPVKPIANQLNNFSPAFGRVEKLLLKLSAGKVREGYIFLIKNPAGATQVFQTLKEELKTDDRLLLALNDKLADGTDVSWIWDGQFEQLIGKSLPVNVVVSGTRANDLALRLKYAGFPSKSLDVYPDLKKALTQAKRGLQGRLFIMPTYTALLELQKILAKSGVKRPYWQES